MRQARYRPHSLRRLLSVILAGELCLVSLGCHQYYYYGNPPYSPCAPPPSTVQYGSVCDVPTQVVDGGTAVADSSSRSTTIVGSKAPTKVVVSQPKNNAPFSWRPSDPDSGVATTSVDGGLDDTTTKR
jgi:hypothetical protein